MCLIYPQWPSVSTVPVSVQSPRAATIFWYTMSYLLLFQTGVPKDQSWSRTSSQMVLTRVPTLDDSKAVQKEWVVFEMLHNPSGKLMLTSRYMFVGTNWYGCGTEPNGYLIDSFNIFQPGGIFRFAWSASRWLTPRGMLFAAAPQPKSWFGRRSWHLCEDMCEACRVEASEGILFFSLKLARARSFSHWKKHLTHLT